MKSVHTQRRKLLKGIGGSIATSLLLSSSVSAKENANDPYKFDVSKLPASVGYVEDPENRQEEAWDAAKEIYELERSVSDELDQYSTEDIAEVMEKASAARSDLRSFSRLIEVLHENDLAGIIDESLLNSIGKRADIIVRWAPVIGGVNNVLKKAETFATAIDGSADFEEGLSEAQRSKYMNFVLSIACLCLEVGLMWVGAPFKLAWKGTHEIFFARSGTLFRLGRYGGDRFVAFFMSEVHWELREALFDDVVTTDKARWVTNEVNEFRQEPEFTELRDDAESLIDEHSEFKISDYESYDFIEEQAGEAADAGTDVFGEVLELMPKGFGSDSSSEESLVLKSTMDWGEDAEEDDNGLFSGF